MSAGTLNATLSIIFCIYFTLNSSLVRAPVNYANWEADKLQACLCDDGWEGYDCSQRSCPKGKDPTKPTDLSHSIHYRPEEVFELQCQADAGYFAIFALGRYTEPIPYDADPTYLRRVLEGLSTSAGEWLCIAYCWCVVVTCCERFVCLRVVAGAVEHSMV